MYYANWCDQNQISQSWVDMWHSKRPKVLGMQDRRAYILSPLSTFFQVSSFFFVIPHSTVWFKHWRAPNQISSDNFWALLHSMCAGHPMQIWSSSSHTNPPAAFHLSNQVLAITPSISLSIKPLVIMPFENAFILCFHKSSCYLTPFLLTHPLTQIQVTLLSGAFSNLHCRSSNHLICSALNSQLFDRFPYCNLQFPRHIEFPSWHSHLPDVSRGAWALFGSNILMSLKGLKYRRNTRIEPQYASYPNEFLHVNHFSFAVIYPSSCMYPFFYKIEPQRQKWSA